MTESTEPSFPRSSEQEAAPRSPHHRGVVIGCVAFVGLMLAATYAAVPFYTLFCRATGYGGTPRIAEAAPNHTLDRRFEIRFDSNVNGMPWSFRPQDPVVTVKAGEVKTIAYRVENSSDKPITGVATYNVTPEEAAPYFSKISCFCFTQQTIKPGSSEELPVVFFVDPAIAKDKNLDDIATITLSYTFFPSKTQVIPVAAAQPGSPSKT